MSSLVTATANDLAANLRHHAEAARGAYATATERALRCDIAVFSAWALDAGRSPLPASAETVVAFIDAMAETKATATVRRYVSSIATFHRAAGAPSPTEALEVKLALRRMHRERGRAQRQASPLNRPLLDRLIAVGSASLRDLRNRALLAVAYDTLARQSELAALLVADLAPGGDGSGTIIIRRSKTDAEGAGMVRYLAPDTMRRVSTWMAAAGHADGTLFRATLKGGRVGGPLASGEVARLFKGVARAAGLSGEETARISGHSTRVGAAQDMAGHGVELPAIMQSGGWRSAEMVARYTARLDAKRSGAAKLAVAQNRA